MLRHAVFVDAKSTVSVEWGWWVLVHDLGIMPTRYLGTASSLLNKVYPGWPLNREKLVADNTCIATTLSLFTAHQADSPAKREETVLTAD